MSLYFALFYNMFPLLAADPGGGGGGAGTGNGDAAGGSLWSLLMPFLLMFVIFYFLIIRPQRKSQRQKQEMLSNLRKHDEVITRGGMIGTVIEVRDDKDEVLVDISKGMRVRIRRPAIEGVFPKDDGSAKDEDTENR